ncbi:MAG: LysM peptidoglycan-binding domain-containing protein [Gammaproteobacteria bacterium]|nr:LysM peptidoglycan-binding domain-containing protein [Gammaproteobacteria bacterium]
MTRRTSLFLILCACGPALSGCASLGHKTTLAKLAAPVTQAAAPAKPTANLKADAALSTDTATPIPDLDDTSPLIQWQDLTITPVVPHYDDLWDYLGHHFTLSTAGGDGRVQGELNWFIAHGEYLQRVASRARPYLYYIVQQVQAHKMPLDISMLPVVESAFDPFAYSNGRAAGLWQFIPGTGRHFDLKQNWWYDGRRDVAASTRAALDYLQFLHDQFNGDWLLALAAYNSGGGTVTRAIERNQRRGLPTDFWHLDLPAETRAYVPRLLAICQLVATRGHDGVDLPPVPNQAYLAQVAVGGQIDLAEAAKLAGITTEQMYLLNPGFNRWATDPDGPYSLFVPLDKKDAFMQALASLPPHDRVQWATHRVRAGDTLGGVARHYRTNVAVLRQLNGIHGNIIRVHQTLLVPVARETLADATLHAEVRVARLHRYGRPSRGGMVHRVKNGESLWTIAHLYRVSVEVLARWNGLSIRSVLHVGQRITIPSRHARVMTTAYDDRGATLRDIQRAIHYTVREGDSLYSISTRFRVHIDDIASWNDLSTRQLLHPGQQLKLFIDVTEQSGASG